MQKFYGEGMNIVTKCEPMNGRKARKSQGEGGPEDQADSWRYNTCDNIYFDQSEVTRSGKE